MNFFMLILIKIIFFPFLKHYGFPTFCYHTVHLPLSCLTTVASIIILCYLQTVMANNFKFRKSFFRKIFSEFKIIRKGKYVFIKKIFGMDVNYLSNNPMTALETNSYTSTNSKSPQLFNLNFGPLFVMKKINRSIKNHSIYLLLIRNGYFLSS